MNADLMQAAHAQMEHLDVVERVERLAVVQEALTWLGTPYLHQGRIRGAGVDCGQLLECVFEGAGVIQPTKIEDYPHDWHLHRSEERYLETVERVAHKVDRDPLPGDIILYRFDKAISHGAIVVAWPTLIHSYIRLGVILDDAERNGILRKAQQGVWSVWPALQPGQMIVPAFIAQAIRNGGA